MVIVSKAALFYQLVIEYNALLNTAVSSIVPLCMDEIDNNKESNDVDDDEEMEESLEEIEHELCMLMSGMSRKRTLVIDTAKSFKNRKRRKKYDTIKLHFTNPFTMEQQVYTFDYSIWYANYIVDPSPQNRKWAKISRKRFRMAYTSFLELNEMCVSSYFFQQWSTTTSVDPFNKKR